LAAFEGFHKQTFKQSTILSAFRKVGIVPYDPKAVLDPLKEQKERARLAELVLPSEEEEEEEEEVDSKRPITPTNTTEMWSASELLWRDLGRAEDEDSICPGLCRRIEQFLRGASIQLDMKDQLEKDLRATEAAQTARKARNTMSQRQIQGGGMVTVEGSRRRIEQRKIGDQKVETARFKKLLKRDRKALFTQFDNAAVKAREMIRLEKLLEAYDQEV
jgi:hypothetical protein